MPNHPGPIEAELLVERDLCALADPEQLELLRDKVPGRDAGTAVEVARRRGPGRPRGALGKRNSKFREQILAMGPHPALALQRAYSTPVEVLAAQLNCTKFEAAQLAIRAAAELLPYIEGKQPVTIDMRQQHDVVLIMGGAPGVDGGQLDAIADEVNAGASQGIDWGEVEIEDVEAMLDPSQQGEP